MILEKIFHNTLGLKLVGTDYFAWRDQYGYMVKTQIRRNQTGDTTFVDNVYPVARIINSDLAECDNPTYATLTPDQRYKSLILIDPIGEMQLTPNPQIPQRRGLNFSQNFAVRVWINYTKIDGDPSGDEALAMEIIREWHGQSYKQIQIPVIVAGVQAETIYINKMVSRLVSEMEHTPEAVFGKWTFSKDQALFMNDYGFFGLVFNVSGLMIKDCVPSFPVELKDDCGVSDGIDFTVSIANQNDEESVCIGQDFVMYGTVEGGLGEPTYQWYEVINEEPVEIEGATEINYEHEAEEIEGIHYYQLAVTMGATTITSNTLEVYFVESPGVYINAVPDTITTSEASVLLSEVLGGYGGNNYQWQWYDGAEWQPIDGATDANFGVSGAVYGVGVHQFRLEVTQESVTCKTVSTYLTVTVITP